MDTKRVPEAAATRLGVMMCLVWDQDHCTYCKKERVPYASTEPPSYGDGSIEHPKRQPGYGSYISDKMKTPWNNK